MLQTEKDIIELIRQDVWMMELLATVKGLNLSDWWICAGFVRSKIWDVLHGYEEKTVLSDVDVIYFDDKNTDEQQEKYIEARLQVMLPRIPWSVKNQARMHRRNQVEPYTSTVDAMMKFPETATALGVRLDRYDNLILSAPHGIEDAINLAVKPTPYFTADNRRLEVYRSRMEQKNWKRYWPNITIADLD